VAVPPASAPAPVGSLGREELQQTFLRVVADRTGYPVEMLALDANLEADLGIDSIKRVEILGAVQQQLPPAVAERVRGAMETLTRAKTLGAIVDAVAPLFGQAEALPVAVPPASAPAPVGSLGREELQQTFLRVVADRTGYPVEMLALDANLEADLGIDSIKRVEILGAVQQQLPAAVAERVRGAMETLTRAKTLGAIVEVVTPFLGTAPPPSLAAVSSSIPHPEDIAHPAGHSEESTPARFLLEMIDCPLPSGSSAPLPEGVIVITADALGVEARAAAALTAQGARVVVAEMGEGYAVLAPNRYRVALHEPELATRFGREVREMHGPVGGILHLAPLRGTAPLTHMEFSDWRAELAYRVKSLFALAGALGPDLCRAKRGFVVAVTGQGGTFGVHGLPAAHFPGDGGVAGLIKTLALEWPDTHCRVVDVDPADGPDRIAAGVVAELARDQEVEVGRVGARRLGMRLRPTACPIVTDNGMSPGDAPVILITGGARGITSEIAEELAQRYRPTLILVGRRPLPSAEEAAETAGLTSPREMKAALIARLQEGDRRPTPAVVEHAYGQLLRDRQVRQRIAALRAAGAAVVYRQLDVQDPRALRACIEDVYVQYGRLDGVVHGAGLIEDKLLVEKDAASFNRVFDTKVDSAFVLARALRLDSLKFFVLFSSVAGRYGNRGQADYTAANDVLNKLARHLDARVAPRVVALNWGPWAGSGMVSDVVAQQFAARQVELVEPALGRAWFASELQSGKKGDAEVVLGRGPWVRASVPGPTLVAMFSHLSLLNGTSPALRERETWEREYLLDPTEDVYLLDHQIDGKPVFPLAMAMELMAEAAQSGWPDRRVVALQAVNVLRGIVLTGGPTRIGISARVRTQAAPTGELPIDVTLANPHDERVHYRATVLLGVASVLPRVALPGPQTALKPFPLGATEAYDRWLFQGPAFQGIVSIDGISAEGILATLRASAPRECLRRRPAEDWLIDPVVMDSAFQMAILWARFHLDMTPLPSGFRMYHCVAPLIGPAVHADLRSQASAGGQVLDIQIAFRSPEGRLLGYMENLQANCSRALNRVAGRKGAELVR